MHDPEDLVVEIDIDVATVNTGGRSLDDSIIDVILAEQLVKSIALAAQAVSIAENYAEDKLDTLSEQVTYIMDELSSVYQEVLATMVADAQDVLPANYFVDEDTGQQYTYEFCRKKSHLALVLTAVEDEGGT